MARRGRKRRLGLEDEYWKLMADGVGTVMACRQFGIGRKTGYRWRAESGGLAPQRDSEQMHSSRYLSLLDRQRIASLRARGVDADEDANEDVGPRRGLMIPASMGLRFQIPPIWTASPSRRGGAPTAAGPSNGPRPKRTPGDRVGSAVNTYAPPGKSPSDSSSANSSTTRTSR